MQTDGVEAAIKRNSETFRSRGIGTAQMEFPANGPAPALRGLLIFNDENLAPPRVTSLVSTAVLRRSDSHCGRNGLRIKNFWRMAKVPDCLVRGNSGGSPVGSHLCNDPVGTHHLAHHCDLDGLSQLEKAA